MQAVMAHAEAARYSNVHLVLPRWPLLSLLQPSSGAAVHAAVLRLGEATPASRLQRARRILSASVADHLRLWCSEGVGTHSNTKQCRLARSAHSRSLARWRALTAPAGRLACACLTHRRRFHRDRQTTRPRNKRNTEDQAGSQSTGSVYTICGRSAANIQLSLTRRPKVKVGRGV